jgi:diadenosine tetraphosphate (Ap4A) HIT family hydrolase
MNATLAKFGFPGTLIKDYAHWYVLMRPAQATLGALVLAAKSEATAFSALPPAAFAEMADVVRDIEVSLKHFHPYDKINYLMLMMVDPHVHMHVLPRYAALQAFGALAFTDPGWPGPPDLKAAPVLEDDIRNALLRDLREAFGVRNA